VEIVGFGRVLGSLLFVLALFFLFIVLLKRYRNPLTSGTSRTPGSIKLVDQLTLELGRRAVLLEAGGKRSLIVLSKEGAEQIWTQDCAHDTDTTR